MSLFGADDGMSLSQAAEESAHFSEELQCESAVAAFDEPPSSSAVAHEFELGDDTD